METEPDWPAGRAGGRLRVPVAVAATTIARMRIAITGKGGSGKSTVAALLVEHLRAQGRRVLAVDADVNVHLAPLLGAPASAETALSHPVNATAIRRHLLGSNPYVGAVERFIPTTPPGPGSGRVTLDPDDPVLSGHARALDARTHVVHVGTYEADDIGAGCYHGHLSILENVLSHAHLTDGDWVVCDMVAGTDAFANSLHAQFDLIVVVVEPTPEAVSVACRYRDLAAAAGIGDLVGFLGNKVADEEDLDYLRRELGEPPLAVLSSQRGLRRARQAGERPRPSDLDDTTALGRVVERAERRPMGERRRAELLRSLHLRQADQGWIRNAHGDVTGQLGPDRLQPVGVS